MYWRNEGLLHMQWRGLFLIMIAHIHLQVLITGVKAATPSIASCPQYVAENETLACMCFKPDSCVPPYTLYWVGTDRNSDALVVPAVRREDDGKQYTCQLTCNGQISTANYTLRVAHGPKSVEVTGQIPFITDGMQVLNLTCLATDVYPAAYYSWTHSRTNSTCSKNSNETTCSFVPQRVDDLKVVTCTAYNSVVTRMQNSKNITIDLQYTPPESPHIQGPDQILKAGDILSCSVTGGKPLVMSVNFTCDNPQHPDQNDTVNSTSVTSYMTINTSQANDDNMTCHCSAYWAPEPGYYTNSVITIFRTEYPPRGAPYIFRSPMNQILKFGDYLSCEVTGGKPPVENITFNCTNQGHGHKAILTNQTVTSRLTIDTSKATDDNMTCHCSAYWAPEPGHYTKSDSASFRTEYPAKIETFTWNDDTDTVTVTASHNTNVTLMCEAHGLPSPTITLHGPNNEYLDGNLTQRKDTDSRMEHTIVMVNDTHMGNYTCKAVNGVRNVTETSLITLNVNFPPRLAFSDGPGHSPDTAVNMSEQGIDIELRAYPTPDSFSFAVYDKNNGHTSDISTDSGMFTRTIPQRGPGSSEVTCHIKAKFTELIGRLYMVTISNGFGSVSYYFNVIGVPPALDSVDIGLIVGVVVGAAAVLIIIIVVVCCCYCKRKNEKKHRDQSMLHSIDSSTQGRSNPTFNEDTHGNDSGIDEKNSPPLHMSTSKPVQHQLKAGCEVREGDMRKKSSSGQAYEVTSLVKGGGARIAGETTKPPATGYAEPWRDLHIDMPDGQPSVKKPPAHTTATSAENNSSPDRYTGPGGEEYASVGEHGKGGTAAKPTVGNTGNYAKMDDCSGRTPGSHSYTNVDSNQKSKPPYINVPADRPLEMDPRDPSFDSPGYSTVAQASRDKGNKTSSKEMHSGAESTDARGSDTYDHFSRQGQQSRAFDTTYAHMQDF